MKKTMLFVIGLIAVGSLAYFGAYHFYLSERPETEYVEQIPLQRSVSPAETGQENNLPEYYVAKIEQDMLMIYKMPEETLYDSVETSSLNFHGTEETQLMNGISFESLKEVFEFLENSMS